MELNQVDVWQASLTLSPEQQRIASAALNATEIARANRFYFKQHQVRFIAARAALRFILADYLPCTAADINFEYTQHGKPFLQAEQNPEDLRFNLSHSGDIAVYAICRAVEVGIDIEKYQCKPYLGIAQRFFSLHEQRQLQALPEAQQQQAFFHIWSQKEAFIKAVGQGLSYPLDQFTVSAEAPARLLAIANDDASQWTMHNIKTPREFISSLAFRERIKQLHCYKFAFPSTKQ